MSSRRRISQPWWWVEVFSFMLEPGEREVVCGDLAESGKTGNQALREVLGLIVLRQGALLKGWRPWLSLLGLIVPLGMLLSIISRRTASVSSVYIWMYANNWDWSLLGYRGFWYQGISTFAEILAMFVTLACWSWTSGFVLGYTSRRVIRINGVLFCLMLAFGVLFGAPLYLVCLDRYMQHNFGFPAIGYHSVPRAPVSAVMFYRAIFPLIVQAVLVVLPSLLGMGQGAKAVRLRLTLRTTLWTAAISSLVLVVVQNPDLRIFLNLHGVRGTWWRYSQGSVLQSLAYWPLAYLLATAIGRRLQRFSWSLH